jgi:hypothetical protein
MPSTLRVYGSLTDQDGRELSFAEVALFRRHLRRREMLGVTRASEEGHYSIEVEWPEAGPGKVLVVVEATAERLEQPVESAMVEATPYLEIDLQQPPIDPSEFGILSRSVLLQLERLPLIDVVETDEHPDVSFLSQEIGRTSEEIMRLVVATRLEANYAVASAAFYAFLRLRVPSALPVPLLDASAGFQLVDPLVQRIAALIFALPPETQTQTIEAAVTEKLIEPLQSIDQIVAAMQTHRSTNLLDQPYLVGKTPLRDLLGVSGLPPAKHETFAAALAANASTMRNFWRVLATGQQGLTVAEASAAQRALEVGAFVKNHVPLVQALLSRFQQGQLSTLEDMARLSVDEWIRLVDEVGPPSNIQAAGNQTPAEVFARVVYTRITRAYPTAALAARIGTAALVPTPEQAPLARFFSNNPTLDLVKHTLTTWIGQNAQTAFAGINAEDRPAVLDNAKRFQRVLRVTHDVEPAQALLSAGFASAAQISMLGMRQFVVQATAAGLGSAEAGRVFRSASHRYATTVSLYLQLNRDITGIWPKGIGSTAAADDPIASAVERDQSLATLFGSQDYCATDECTSVLSPAAYLCDLLLWLRNHQNQGDLATALDALFARRPDIGHLLLNCPNTDVPLPYIDLVNELLEDSVSPPASPAWNQTTQTAPELRAAPEYVNDAAYDVLAASSYPHTLPYDRALDELRTCLAQSGVTLWQLRQSLLPLHAPSLASRVAVAAERFTIDPHEQDLITTANFVTAAVAWNTPSPGADLVPVPAFLRAASISYAQLLELVEVVWVRAGGPSLGVNGVNDACDLTAQSLAPAPIAPDVLDRLHRFLRLWRHSPWEMWELDLLVRSPAVANGTLDGSGLVALLDFRSLIEITGLAVDEQLAFYGDLDNTPGGHLATDGSRTVPLFARLFLDPAVPVDADLAALSTGGPVTHPNLSDHLPAIQAALEVSSADAALLFAAPVTDGQLTMANLSQLFRTVQLARAAGASLEELLRILPLTTAGSLASALASPAATLAFLEEVKSTRQSGFTADALVYVLTRSATTTGITDDQITQVVLPAVRSAIQQTHDEIFSSADPPLTILQREMAQVPPLNSPTLLATAISIVNDTFTGTLAARNAFIATNLASFMDVATAESDLAPLPGGLSAAARQAAVNLRAGELLTPLATFLTQKRVIAAVAPNLGLQPDIAALLVSRLAIPGSSSTLLAVLTVPHLIDKVAGNYLVLDRTNYADQYTAIDLLDKVATVVKALHLVETDLNWLLDHQADYGGLDLAQLPVVATQSDQPLKSLLSTSLVVKLERAFGPAAPGVSPADLYGLIGSVAASTIASESAAQTALAAITGWAPADLSALGSALGTAFPADYTSPATYDALRRLEAMLTVAGAGGSQLVTWAGPDPDLTTATSARAALESRYSHDDWLALAPKIMDPVRERRSAALQAYLIAERDGAGQYLYPDANALFDHFLIDVQMSSCEVTTRVVQAYAAVQLFVERCLMGLEEPHVVINPSADDTWSQWSWMKRYRIWEASREVFLYPENWLIETQRPTRTEIFEQFEQEVRQVENTTDNLEVIVENYIQRLDELAHLHVTGTCPDPASGDIHVVARTAADPPRYYHRVFHDRVWSGWEQIKLDVKAHHAVPAIYRGRLCLFWLDVSVANEPRQSLPLAQASTSAPSQEVARYVSIGLSFSIYRSSGWSPVQKAKGHLFDVPLMSSHTVAHPSAVEALFTLKVQAPTPAPGFGASLLVDVFRLGGYTPVPIFSSWFPILDRPNAGVHIGRATFDARFADLEQRDLPVAVLGNESGLLQHARSTYGPDADPLIPLPEAQADPDIQPEPGLVPKAGALATLGSNASTLPLTFTSLGALEQAVGELLHTASVPFRVVGDVSDVAFDPSGHFFYEDNRRCYFVEGRRFYQWGSAWLPIVPSYASADPFEIRYEFHRFYHPYTRLLWHQVAGGGFAALYNRDLQTVPDTIDPSGADHFSFRNTYQPSTPRVAWGEDNEIMDFARDAAYGVYNWELFFHTPLYVAERLSQNQQFEDALTWYQYIFNPTRQGPEPVPQRFWIPKPLNSLTTPQIVAQAIENLLVLVDQHDANAIAEVTSWRRNPFNPFLLADQRPVAYMKRAVMSYLDNLIAWADNLFSTDSREALNEATLLYVQAAEILGPQPQAVVPPHHADASYDDLAPQLDAFANAMVDIENYVPVGGSGGNGNGQPVPRPQTFYFKVPPNERLLGYWTTVADRLFKLRHCQNIAGVTRELALFDAPIDPGLLVAAQAAGVDLGSVLNDLQTARPGYRFATLYAQALDFCNAVIAYGAELLAALQQKDAQALAQLMAGQQLQIETENGQILQSQVDAASQDLAALRQALALAQAQFDFNNDRKWANEFEYTALTMKALLGAANLGIGIGFLIAGGLSAIPEFSLGVAGFGGSPDVGATAGGKAASDAASNASDAGKAFATGLDKGSDASMMAGGFQERKEQNNEKGKEAGIQIQLVQAQIAASQVRHDIAAQQLVNHQNQLERIQQQIDTITDMFTSEDLYDWMIGRLSDTYFNAYRIAYKLCQQAERCYRYELGLTTSSFVQFGYWDSLKKGLQSGESLVLDLRRMQASYLEQNARRFEMSRYVSLASLDPQALLTLIETGTCDFDLPESLFDGDYPGHYQRRLQRVSVTVVYPNPGRFDNVKSTLTMKHNSVRVSTDLGSGYGRQGPADTRFVDEFGAVPQRIALGNGQDDPGLFLTSINDNLADPRYLPFEGAGAISSWNLTLPAVCNEIDLGTVSDVVIHVYYSALDGGDSFAQAVSADNAANAPTAGAIVLSAASDFPSAWATFLAPAAGGSDQVLTLGVEASKFPGWTRGKNLTITSLTVLATSDRPGGFVLRPEAPLPTADITMAPMAGTANPTVSSGNVAPPPASPGAWSLKIRASDATDFRSLVATDVGDILLLIHFQVS